MIRRVCISCLPRSLAMVQNISLEFHLLLEGVNYSGHEPVREFRGSTPFNDSAPTWHSDRTPS